MERIVVHLAATFARFSAWAREAISTAVFKRRGITRTEHERNLAVARDLREQAHRLTA